MASIKGVIIISVLIALCATIYFNWFLDGATKYNIYVSPETQSSIANITKHIEAINESTAELEENVRGIAKGNLQSIFLIPDGVASVFNIVIDSMRSILTIQTEFTKSIGLPDYVYMVVYIIIILTILFLIVSAVIKWRTD